MHRPGKISTWFSSSSVARPRKTETPLRLFVVQLLCFTLFFQSTGIAQALPSRPVEPTLVSLGPTGVDSDGEGESPVDRVWARSQELVRNAWTPVSSWVESGRQLVGERFTEAFAAALVASRPEPVQIASLAPSVVLLSGSLAAQGDVQTSSARPPTPPRLAGRSQPEVAVQGLPPKATGSDVSLLTGFNLVSIPDEPSNTDPAIVLAGIASQLSAAFVYDACDAADPWKLYDPANPAASDLDAIDHTQGLWLDVTSPAVLPVTGTQPPTTQIQLCTGWNLIGYPLAQARAVQTALASIDGKYLRVFGFELGDSADPWEVYDVSTPAWANDLQLMQRGRGYWVLVTEDTILDYENVGAPPVVEITSPASRAEVASITDVLGSVRSNLLDRWTVSFRPSGDGGPYTEFGRGTTPVDEAVLGSFDPTTLLNGMYDLKLEALDLSGQIVETVIPIVVDGQLKLGNFSLSFVDLALPLSGLDIEVQRTYDSRDKRQGDFGFGWTLDLKQGSYKNNRIPGDGWVIVESQPPVIFPCVGGVETKDHLTTIRLSDREVYRFRLEVFNTGPALGSCLGQTRFVYIDGPTPGANLAILGNSDVVWSSGSDFLFDAVATEIFNPRNVRLTTRDGREFDLNLDQGVTRLRDTNGNELQISPNAITHSSGTSISMTRDAAGRITQITDPLSQTIDYTYDAAGDLVSVTDRNGDTAQMTYLADHYLEDVIDPRGVRGTRSEFDDAGRLIKIIDASGMELVFDRDLDARREVVTDRLGNARVLEYDARGNVVRQTDATGTSVSRIFDANDNVLSETDGLGNTTHFTWSTSNDLLKIRDGLGLETELTYDAAGRLLSMIDGGGNAVVNTYDTNGNLLTFSDPTGNSTTLTYDARGNVLTETDALAGVTTNEYDGRGNLIRRVDSTGVETTFTYNLLGDLLTETTSRSTPSGVEMLVTTFAYDAVGRLVSRVLADGTSFSSGYDASGNVTRETDRLGRVTTFAYDLRNNRVLTTYSDGTSDTQVFDAEDNLVSRTDREGRTTSFTYDAAGRQIRTTFVDGSSISTEYDAAGQIVGQTDERGNTTMFVYDANGRELSRTDALGRIVATTYDALGRQLTSTDPTGNVRAWEYDAAGRQTRVVFPDGTDRQMAYDVAGRMVSETDPAGRTTAFAYDLAGRLTQVTDAAGGVTVFEYNEQGDRVAQTDANGNETRWEFDPLGRMIRRILPDGAAESFVYDAVGNVTSRTDFAGRVTTQVYDSNDRLIERVLPNGTRTTFTYTATGLRATAVDGRGTTSYSYDTRNRLTEVTHPDGRSLSYAYDLAGNRVEMTANLAALILTTRYTYDDANRLTTVTDPNGGVYAHSYDLNGNRAGLAFPNSISTSYTYDTLDRLVALATVDDASVTVQGYAYTLGLAGNRTQIDEHDGTVRSYTHDSLYRLTNESVVGAGGPVYSNAFTYDAVGNRQSRNHTASDGSIASIGYSYDARDRLLTEGAQAWVWNATGTLASKTSEADYAWDFEDRLQQVTLADGTQVVYSYDADGIRVRTETTPPAGPTEVEDYLVDVAQPLSQVIATSDGSGALSSYYVRGLDLLAVIRPSETRYVHADGQNSVRVLTDELGAVADRYTYEAFGTLLDHVGSDPLPFLFTGEPLDPNVGFAYHRARWMDPSVGRFVSMDPFGGFKTDPISLHRYLYAHGNPVDRDDPTGLFSGGLTGLGVSMAIGGIVSGIFAGIFSNHSPDTKEFWGDVGKGVAFGALTAPVGGLFAKVFAPFAKLTIRPLLSLLGRLGRVVLTGKGPTGKLFVKISRFFFNTNVKYPPVKSTFLGRALQRLFPNVQWQQHHVFIQQAWSRSGGPNQIFDSVAANEGLRRVGNGLWNLLPIPASLNQTLGRSVVGTQAFATAYYSILVFGPFHTLFNFFGDG